jgi:hypothetical protein
MHDPGGSGCKIFPLMSNKRLRQVIMRGLDIQAAGKPLTSVQLAPLIEPTPTATLANAEGEMSGYEMGSLTVDCKA